MGAENVSNASYGKRSLAFIVDLALYFIILEVLCRSIGQVLVSMSPIKTPPIISRLEMKGDLYGSIVGFILFCFKDAFNGASIGKRLVGIGVRDGETPSQIPNLLNLVMRNMTLMILPVEVLVVLCLSDGRRIGDFSCGTQVVELNRD